MDAGRRRAHLGRGPAALLGPPSAADISSIPFLPSPCLCIPHMGLLAPVPQPPGAFHINHLPYWETSSNWEAVEGRRESEARTESGLSTGCSSTRPAKEAPSSQVSFLQLRDPLTKAVSDSASTRISVFFPAWITIQSKPHANCSPQVPSPLCTSGLSRSHLHPHLFLCCLCGAVVSASSLRACLSPTPSLSYMHFEIKLMRYYAGGEQCLYFKMSLFTASRALLPPPYN